MKQPWVVNSLRVPSAHSYIWEHIVLLAPTLVGDPRHQHCDQRLWEQSLQQPGSALPIACTLSAAELFSVGYLVKPIKLQQLRQMK